MAQMRKQEYRILYLVEKRSSGASESTVRSVTGLSGFRSMPRVSGTTSPSLLRNMHCTCIAFDECRMVISFIVAIDRCRLMAMLKRNRS